MEAFKIKNLTYYYPKNERPALKNINLTVSEGEFILLLGKSGSGKSTLGRVFNEIVPQFYGGKIAGDVQGKYDVGMVFQDPEKQLVMDTVERELAFGLENLGLEYSVMKRKVMETLSFLNIHGLKDKKTYELSGGQKQKVAIGSILAMGYRFLVLDEPTSQLDPTAAEEVLNVLSRLNEELGYTIILIEQRIDRCFHLADRILFMDDGSITFDGNNKQFIDWNKPISREFLPPVASFFSQFQYKDIPFTIKEGRKKLNKCELDFLKENDRYKAEIIKKPVIKIKGLYYTYDNKIKALKEINLNVYKSEVLSIMGETGGGKSTLLKSISGLVKPDKGDIEIDGRIGYLSQNPNDYLFNDTVDKELRYTMDNSNLKDYTQIDNILRELDIYKHKDSNPRDLSGGEKQRVALASVLVMDPDILILDEPTRGLDNELKDKLGNIIINMKNKGKTIILVTHDVEFSAKYCDRVGFIFDGEIVQIGSKYEMLNSGIYYSTQLSKLFTGFANGILTINDTLDIPERIKGEDVAG